MSFTIVDVETTYQFRESVRFECVDQDPCRTVTVIARERGGAGHQCLQRSLGLEKDAFNSFPDLNKKGQPLSPVQDLCTHLRRNITALSLFRFLPRNRLVRRQGDLCHGKGLKCD